MQENFHELEEKVFHLELINKLLEAENTELKEVIRKVKNIPKKPLKISFKDRLKNTFIYRILRKIKHIIVRKNHE